jgi:hypothetical protein
MLVYLELDSVLTMLVHVDFSVSQTKSVEELRLVRLIIKYVKIWSQCT